jgi:predicted permease
MQTLVADLRYSLRQLRRSPGFTLTAILTLTTAIAANVVAFGVVDALLLHPLAAREPGRLVEVQKRHEGGGLNLSYPTYRDLRDRNRSFSALAAARITRVGFGVNGNTEPVWGYEVSGNYFAMLGVKPVLGRFIAEPDDAKVNGSPVVVLSYANWQVRFNSDPGIVGKTVLVSKHPYTVIGVTPKNFTGTERFVWPDIWLPYQDSPEIEGFNWLEARGNNGTWVVGRLKDGVTPTEATADLQRIAGQLAKEYPDDNAGLALRVTKPGMLGDVLGGPIREFLAGVMAMAALVLLAACANLGSLFSSQMTDRAKELGIRLAIGSSRGRILRQLLTESVLVALAGGVAASLFSAALLNGLARWRPNFEELPVQFLVQPDWTVFGFSALLALVTGILFGMIPARQVWLADPNQTLKSAGSTAAAGDRSRMQSALITVQIALCCLLVTASFVALRGLQRTFDAPLGFDPQGVMLATMDVHLAGYAPARQAAVQQRLLASVSAIPGVTAAAYSDTTPLSVDNSSNTIYAPGTTDFSVANARFDAVDYCVSPGYFAATGTRLLAGRDFTVHDDASKPAVAIVNWTFAKRLFGVARAEDAVGRRYPTGMGSETEVIGVVADGKYEALTEDAKPALFWPILQSPRAGTVLIVKFAKSQQDTAEIAGAMRRAIAQVDGGMPVFTIASWTDALGLVTFPARAATIALGVLGALAIMLAVTGIFGLASYTVSRQMRELGIRVALGAQGWQVLRAALGRTAVLLSMGSVFGLLLGFVTTRLLAGIVYQATASDPVVVVAGVLTMALLGAISSALPARRALRVDPMALLRED